MTEKTETNDINLGELTLSGLIALMHLLADEIELRMMQDAH